MNFRQIRQPSLLWRVLLVTSIATVALFSATAYLLASYAIRVTGQSLEDEVQASLREVEVLWRARADSLSRASELLSNMSDVRGAFLTRDAATIRDTAADLWASASREDAVFLVFDPTGRKITSLGGAASDLPSLGPMLPALERHFPKQVSGFVLEGSRLFFTVLTPVYVASGHGQALLNVLATGFEINDRLAASLGRATGGSDFVFRSGGAVRASTLPSYSSQSGSDASSGSMHRARVGGTEYATLSNPLLDLSGNPIGELSVMRSLAATNRKFRELKVQITLVLVTALLMALLLSYALVRRIIKPLEELDQGASEIARRNYGYRLNLEGDDELGRLARTFNSMCDSIQASREELILQERMNTIGRLSSSIVHDLRNPLAAIYGGAEMLADDESLPPQQSRRLAISIYRASRHIQEMLQDLADSSRGKAEPIETCRLIEIVDAVQTLLAPQAEKQGTRIIVNVPDLLELPVERSRMERVFLNLMSNSLEAMQQGGELRVSAERQNGDCVIEIDDTGVGMTEEVRQKLFQPFFSHGKRNGLGLGLAFSRQAVADHGGELWASQKEGPGARFCMRLPAH